MTEQKKQRRERLSDRDHKRANRIGHTIYGLLQVLEEMYPVDLDLKIAMPAVKRFITTTAASEEEELGAESAPMAGS